MERVRINASRAYDVVIGLGVLDTVGDELSHLVKSRTVAIVADDVTYPLFGARTKASLESAGFYTCEYIIPHGEESKSAENYIRILEFLAERGLSRTDCLVALGGGVVGDLSGFVAASFLRGIPFVQIPTTLLAAVDSSVGGKCAINLQAGKNLAGAFYQPSVVLCDTEIIGSLPDDIFSEGMAEVIKYGAIRSEKVFGLIEDGARENLGELISECVRIKRDVVCEDEFDTGLRQLLNFGHTPAHAIERLSDFKISHGAAVAAGMCIMSRAAEKLGLCEAGISDEIEKLCKKFSLPTTAQFSAKDMFAVAMRDKKRALGKITLVIPRTRGESVLYTVSEEETEKFFALGLSEGE